MTLEDDLRRFDELEGRLTGFVSERMLDLARVRVGMRVLDLATGRGEPALKALGRVGPTGLVLGVDVDEAALAVTRERAKGATTLELRVMSVEAVEVTGFDVATCRWGLTNLPQPVAALEAIRRALKPEGRFVAAMWAEPERVPWSMVPRRVTEAFGLLPRIDVTKPGVFRYSTPELITRDFTAAGFVVEHWEELEVPVLEVETSADFVAWVRSVLGRFETFVPPESRSAWQAQLELAGDACRVNGRLRLGGVTRLVVARPC